MLFGAWLGDAGPLLLDSGTPCELRKSNNDKVVWSGTLELRHTANSAGEGPYNLDESGEEVYLCDFGEYEREGSYYIAIPNMDEAMTLKLQRMFSIERLQSQCMVCSGNVPVSD